MRYMKYLALMAVLMLPLAYSQAQVDAGAAAGNNQGYDQGQADRGYPDQGPANQAPPNQGYPDRGYADQTYAGPGYVSGPPVCAYGYYSYYPYACAPYGFYGPRWFVGGVFIGAGPWYGWGWGHGGYWGRPWVLGSRWYWGRGGPGLWTRLRWLVYGRGYAGGYARGGVVHGGGGFHGGGSGPRWRWLPWRRRIPRWWRWTWWRTSVTESIVRSKERLAALAASRFSLSCQPSFNLERRSEMTFLRL